jgi:hypothetical protein
MTYKKGSTQFVSTTLKRGDNIRLYIWSIFSKFLEVW